MLNNNDTRAYYEGTVEPIYLAISGAILHLGIFEVGDSRAEATTRTKEFLASRTQAPASSTIVDLGSGYCDSARYLVKRFGCRVIGVNLIHSQNRKAQALNRETGQDKQISVIEADFTRSPLPAGCAQVVWSQEAFLHAAGRDRVIYECARLLSPGGRLIFTDILQTGSMEAEETRLVYERVHINSLESFDSYQRLIRDAGLLLEEVTDLSEHVVPSYEDHVDSLRRHRADLIEAIGVEYVDYTIEAMGRWIRAAEEGKLGWGLFVASK
jgi:sarcosine/dimethylglycine N-methyltransferase